MITMSIQEILKMPVSDRISLVEQIWDSLDTSEIQVTSAQKKEIDHRMALDKEGKMSWHTIKEAKSKLQNRV